MFEVELKFHVEHVDEIRSRLIEWGAIRLPTEVHRDHYFDHPCRRFVDTTEALRLRRVNGMASVTYKGPKHLIIPEGSSLESPGEPSASGGFVSDRSVGVKTREELEWELAPGDPDGEKMERLLTLLGFTSVAIVEKKRQSYQVLRGGRELTVALDSIADMGDFVEVECLVAEGGSHEAAAADVASLAAELGLRRVETRSYLRMMLERSV